MTEEDHGEAHKRATELFYGTEHYLPIAWDIKQTLESGRALTTVQANFIHGRLKRYEHLLSRRDYDCLDRLIIQMNRRMDMRGWASITHQESKSWDKILGRSMRYGYTYKDMEFVIGMAIKYDLLESNEEIK